MTSFIAELKRRNVIKVVVAYAIAVWLLFQITSHLLTFDTLAWFIHAFRYILILGFPLIAFFSWSYEFTPEGIKKTQDVPMTESLRYKTDRRLNYIIVGLLVLAAAYTAIDSNNLEKVPETTKPIPASPPKSPPVPLPAVAGETEPSNQPVSIVVLPFANMSENKSNEYIADGITEELINSLAQIQKLEVRGPTSSFYYKGRQVPFVHRNKDLNNISNMLNVEYFLEGSVRKKDDQMRITVQLVKIKTDTHMWLETYEGTMADIYKIEEEIAKSVTDKLNIKVSTAKLDQLSSRMTPNMAALDAYLAGRFLQHQGNLSQAIEQYEKAVILDPEFAIALGTLANAYLTATTVLVYTQADELYKKAEAAASRAIAIDPESVVSLTASAQLQFQRREWSATEQFLKKSIALAPGDYQTNFLYGRFLLAVGRPGEAIDFLQKFVRIEPLAVSGHLFLGIANELSGNGDAAVDYYKRVSELNNQPNPNILVLALEQNSRTRIDEYVASAVNYKNNINVINTDSRDLDQTMYSLLDAPKDAVAKLSQYLANPVFNNPNLRSRIAVWTSYYGEPALTLQIFKELSKSSAFSLWQIWRPLHKPIRQLPEFKDLVGTLGLVDYWRASGNWGDFCRPVDDDFECE